MDLIEFTPERSQFVYTFGGAEPVMRVKPGTALALWSEDAYNHALRSVDDLASKNLDVRYLNPQTGPFYIVGAEPGDTLAIHVVDLQPARDWGASAVMPFFGGLTSTDRTAFLQDPLADTTWIYALDRAARTVTFGLEKGADVRAIETMRTASGGTFVTARVGTRELSFTISQPGLHWVSNCLALLAAVDAVGGDLALAGLALAELGGLAGRGARFAVPVGTGEALIIDESYNANPSSMRATLAVLGAEQAKRKVVVLGEMREMGEESDAYHAALAEPILAAGVRAGILVGERIAPLANAIEGEGDFVHVPDVATARAALSAMLAPGDAVLIKGSNGVGLAAVVAALQGGTL